MAGFEVPGLHLGSCVRNVVSYTYSVFLAIFKSRLLEGQGGQVTAGFGVEQAFAPDSPFFVHGSSENFKLTAAAIDRYPRIKARLRRLGTRLGPR